jgi:hypothetical protein
MTTIDPDDLQVPVRYIRTSETSCPSGWSETSAKADNLAACIHNSTWVITKPMEFVPVAIGDDEQVDRLDQ